MQKCFFEQKTASLLVEYLHAASLCGATLVLFKAMIMPHLFYQGCVITQEKYSARKRKNLTRVQSKRSKQTV